MIEWDDKYSVGISRIDDEHKQFIDIINQAIATKEHSDDPEELREVLYNIAAKDTLLRSIPRQAIYAGKCVRWNPGLPPLDNISIIVVMRWFD